ncbi:hypothetical protein [uncultured Microbulbifer sp.]|uniref:hypothetical protein n=1 Tax=uncultured Microbulbifer sp. TaxID=348147 RepID=UPI00260AC4B5|nr:hypothetical protein [uncultured Microbulbifer sp.]
MHQLYHPRSAWESPQFFGGKTGNERQAQENGQGSCPQTPVDLLSLPVGYAQQTLALFLSILAALPDLLI